MPSPAPNQRSPIRPALRVAAVLVGVLAIVAIAWVVPRLSTEPVRGVEGTERGVPGRPELGPIPGSTRGARSASPSVARASSSRQPGPGLAVEPEDPERPDPQLRVFHRTHGGPDAGIPPAFQPTERRAHIETLTGDAPVRVGASCEVRLLPVRTRSFNCLVRVMCDDVVLYPDDGQRAGYAPCDVEGDLAWRAVDEGVTHADGDPTVHVDLVARRVHISDQHPDGAPRFSAELSVEGPPVPVQRM